MPSFSSSGLLPLAVLMSVPCMVALSFATSSCSSSDDAQGGAGADGGTGSTFVTPPAGCAKTECDVADDACRKPILDAEDTVSSPLITWGPISPSPT
jgi:hypothetical protein